MSQCNKGCGQPGSEENSESLNEPDERCDGVQDSVNRNSQDNVITRSGRVVRPSAVVREKDSDSSSKNSATPVKRRSKSRAQKAKRTKFSYQSGSDSTIVSLQETASHSSQVSGEQMDLTVSVNDGDFDSEQCSSQSQGTSDILLENTNKNAAPGGSKARNRTGGAAKLKSVVTKVTVSEEQTQNDEIDKSINLIMSNEAALERVMKNCMPAFLQMTKQINNSSDLVTNQCRPESMGRESILDRGELSREIIDHAENVPNSHESQSQVITQAQEVVPMAGESDMTLYCRGCTKVGEDNALDQIPIIQNIQNELNRLNMSIGRGETGRNIYNGVSDSDNVTSDESLLMTSSDDMDSSNHDNHGKTDVVNNVFVAGRGGATTTSGQTRRVVEVPQAGGMRVVSAAVGSAKQLEHAELEKVQAEERAREIINQAANAKATLLKPPGENLSTVVNVDPRDSL